MSHTPPSVDDAPAPFGFSDLVTAMAALSVEFRREGDALALRGAGVLTSELRAAVADHKSALLTLCDLRAELERLHGYIIRLRCSDPPKGSRAKAIRYQEQQIERLAARSVAFGGTGDGWDDPADVFADGDQLIGLRAALAELTRGDAPYPLPLPPGCTLLPTANFDPFEHGRLYNGMVSGGQATEAQEQV